MDVNKRGVMPTGSAAGSGGRGNGARYKSPSEYLSGDATGSRAQWGDMGDGNGNLLSNINENKKGTKGRGKNAPYKNFSNLFASHDEDPGMLSIAITEGADALCNDGNDTTKEEGIDGGQGDFEDTDEEPAPEPRPPSRNVINVRLICYLTDVLRAYRNNNGDELSDHLSLRDIHIFKLLTARDYAPVVRRIFDVPVLAEAVIHHIDCLKALLVRNLPMALYSQQACVDAMRYLLDARLKKGETWAALPIETIMYDLSVVMQKAAAEPRTEAPIVTVTWTVTRTETFFRFQGYLCRLVKVYRTGHFHYRR